MKFIHALLALCLVTTAYARPAIIVKESARITLSTTTVDGYQINGPIAVDGDDAIVIGAREETADDYYTITYNAAFRRVRACVNGKLLIEALEPQPRAGNGGLVTYKAAADFDDFREIQP